MKKLIVIWLTVLMLLLSASSVKAECRDTLSPECRVDFDFVLEQAGQYSQILKSKPMVTRCIVKKKNLELRVERGPMIFDVTLFDVQAASCRVENGTAYAVYWKQECHGLKYFFGGVASGAGIILLIVLLL